MKNLVVFSKMGTLRKSRMVPTRPFHSVALDFAGSIQIKADMFKGNKLIIISSYLRIFVCNVTRQFIWN